MPQISVLEQTKTKSQTFIHKLNKRKYEDFDPLELKCMVKMLQHKRILKYLQVIFLFAHLIGGVYFIEERGRVMLSVEEYNLDDIIVKFVYCFSSIILVATNMFGLISFTKSALLYDSIFERVENKYTDLKADTLKVRIIMILLHVLNILRVFSTIYLYSTRDVETNQYFLFRDLELYCFNLTVLSVLCFAQKIKEIFQDVNQLLKRMDQEESLPESHSLFYIIENNICVSEPLKNLEKLKALTQYHNIICNLLDKYNDYYRSVLVLLVICIIGNILWDCTNIIESVVKPSKVHPIGFDFIMYPVMIMISSCQATLAAMVGEHLSQEGESTTVLCYSLLNKMPTHLKSEDEQRIEKQLNFLLDQSKSRNVSLHAGGFFVINWGILGSIAATVTTYSIVIIQFLTNKNTSFSAVTKS